MSTEVETSLAIQILKSKQSMVEYPINNPFFVRGTRRPVGLPQANPRLQI
jgi:hypothetical protein